MTATVPGEETELAVTPDKVFGLEFLDIGRRNYFALEADRSTMPIERPSLTQSSFKKKLLTYHHGHEARHHSKLWGIPGFRVLTITKSAERVASMIEALKSITRGKGSNVFLFTDVGLLSRQHPLSAQWLTGKGEVTLLV